SFRHVVASESVPISEASDWTCRVLVGGLKSTQVYWYRFTDAQGFGSRVGRTITAPADNDPRPARFAFVSCQNANAGAMNAYLRDPDLQDARARWPFVPMWDNHEYSWQGWQGMQVFDGKTRPAQTLKVVANQVFFEYQPARMARPSITSLEEFNPPKVVDTP